MFIGKNKMILNKATVIEAISEYFNKKVDSAFPVRVDDFEVDRSGTGTRSMPDSFVVTIEQDEIDDSPANTIPPDPDGGVS